MSTDKPAATGSGEPHKWWCPTHHITIPTAACPKCLEGVQVVVPTPPASQPTVTLDRETFDKVVAALENYGGRNDYMTWEWNGDGYVWNGGKWDYRKNPRDDANDVLALLRAAEQK